MSTPPPHSPTAIRPSKIARMDDSIDINDATTATVPVPSYRPDAKARRYDRQLRLWASAGQRSLEAARVLLVGSDAAGCQALKNLVLPGIAHFTILSPDITTPQDVATNFFLHPDSVGESIAEETTRYLSELNPAVQGVARKDSPADLLRTDPDFFLSFTLIIASNTTPDVELALSDLLWQASEPAGGSDIPLISIRTSGFIARIQIQHREHSVSDTHPESTHTLRIDQPFETLESFARSLDLDAMDSMEHSHVPWVVLLVRELSIWKEQHNGALPEQDSERAEFKKQVQAGRRKADEENYDEAMNKVYYAWNKSTIPSDLRDLLAEPAVQDVSSNSKNLHILLHVLKHYIDSDPHHLPLTSPSLPDMHSSTTSYVALQNLFKAQYQSDLARFKGIMVDTLARIGLPADAVSDEEVDAFARNVGGVAVVKGTALRDSKEGKGLLAEHIADGFSGQEQPLAGPMYIALLAAERFYSATQRWPGAGDSDDVQADTEQMEELVKTIMGKSGAAQELDDEYVESIAEVVRAGFAVLPTTAAFVGGIVAQEAIKLVTNQYIPLDNTVVIDLVKSTLDKMKL